MKKSFEIESDCLDIVKRIKAVDKDYFVVFDVEKQKFQLHCRSQGKNTYCLTFLFDSLDERAYLHVLKTRVQNSDEIFKSMDAENTRLQEKNVKKVLDDFKEKLYDS